MHSPTLLCYYLGNYVFVVVIFTFWFVFGLNSRFLNKQKNIKLLSHCTKDIIALYTVQALYFHCDGYDHLYLANGKRIKIHNFTNFKQIDNIISYVRFYSNYIKIYKKCLDPNSRGSFKDILFSG